MDICNERQRIDPPKARERMVTVQASANSMDAALKERLHALVLRELDLFRRTALNDLAGVDLHAEARQEIGRAHV